MDIDRFRDLMCFYGKGLGFVFDDLQLDRFFGYMNLLLEWNERINLTAIVQPEDVILKHFIDSLTISKFIDENASVADVGTGAGFPGLALKIFRPDLEITLVDSLNKRVSFLNEVISTLDLKGVYTVHSRVEDFGRDKMFRERFDYATARAVANISVLSEYLLPIVSVGGKCICMKGSNVSEELNIGRNAINVLGGTIEDIFDFYLPESDIARNVIVINKINTTPKKFPRKAGIPVKEPLK